MVRRASHRAGWHYRRALLLYWEETEWCIRARKAGWRVVHVPRPGSGIRAFSATTARSRRYLLHTRNRLLTLAAPRSARRPCWVIAWLQIARTLASWLRSSRNGGACGTIGMRCGAARWTTSSRGGDRCHNERAWRAISLTAHRGHPVRPGCVSVMMPAFNAERFIGRAIGSLRAQTFTDWELIVVDDGSTDATGAIARSAGDPRIRVIRQDNRGEAAARNVALAASTGEYVAFLDADDAFLADHLDRDGHVTRGPTRNTRVCIPTATTSAKTRRAWGRYRAGAGHR